MPQASVQTPAGKKTVFAKGRGQAFNKCLRKGLEG
jgi:hypothetical protein